MCFAPQQRAHFHHVNFQKWFEIARKMHFHMCFASQRRTLFRPQIIGKTVFRDFATLSRAYIFFLLILSLLIFFLLFLFSSLTIPTFAFPSVHIVGSLTAKLLSKIMSFTKRQMDIDVLGCLWKHALAGKACLWFVYFQFCNCMIHPQRLVGAQQSATEQLFGPLPALVLVGQRCRRKRSANLKRMQSHWVQRSCSQVRLSLDLPSDKTMVMLETPKNRKDDVRVPQIIRCTLNSIY